MEQQIKVTKRKPARPKVRYEGELYTIEEVAGDTIRIKGSAGEFCIHKRYVEAVNRESKALLNV